MLTPRVPIQTAKESRACVDTIKTIAKNGVTRPVLAQMTAELEKLAKKTELFSRADFPPPEGPTNMLYEIAGDPDGQFTLYVSSANKGKETPPHNHATWAAIVGIAGEELNKLYTRRDDGTNNDAADVTLDREHTVKAGNPISLMPDDIHSIHVLSDEPTLHLHLYGRRLADLKDRLQFDIESRKAKFFPPNPNIR
jgi:predicted metal-dependent enzyme (double-stranded beta helix superfamily)